MDRLYRIGINYGLASLTPILSWFALGLLIDKDLTNIFSLTYPLQFISGVLLTLFGTGAGIHQLKDKNELAIKSGIILSIGIGLVIFGFLAFNISSYTQFMNMPGKKYELWGIYSIFSIYLQLLQSVAFNMFYFIGKESTANRYCIAFNLINFILICVLSFFFKDNQYFIIITMLIIGVIMSAYVTYKALNKSKKGFRFNIWKCIQYESSGIVNYIMFFLIFLIGLSNTMSYGIKYAESLNFICLITDTQWDITTSICTVAKLDISQGKFDMKTSIQNGYKFIRILIASCISMFVFFGILLEITWSLAIIYFSAELLNFSLFPYYRIRLVYLQLEYSAKKVTIVKLIADTIRIFCGFLLTPFCTVIGQIVCVLFQSITYGKMYKISKT